MEKFSIQQLFFYPFPYYLFSSVNSDTQSNVYQHNQTTHIPILFIVVTSYISIFLTNCIVFTSIPLPAPPTPPQSNDIQYERVGSRYDGTAVIGNVCVLLSSCSERDSSCSSCHSAPVPCSQQMIPPPTKGKK